MPKETSGEENLGNVPTRIEDEGPVNIDLRSATEANRPRIEDEGPVNDGLRSAVEAKSLEDAKRKGVFDRLAELKKGLEDHVERRRKINQQRVKEMDREMALREKGKSRISDPLIEPKAEETQAEERQAEELKEEKPQAVELQAEKPGKINFYSDVDKVTAKTNAEVKEGKKQFYSDVVNRKPDNPI